VLYVTLAIADFCCDINVGWLGSIELHGSSAPKSLAFDPGIDHSIDPGINPFVAWLMTVELCGWFAMELAAYSLCLR
jgi:hypothetical protein